MKKVLFVSSKSFPLNQIKCAAGDVTRFPLKCMIQTVSEPTCNSFLLLSLFLSSYRYAECADSPFGIFIQNIGKLVNKDL